MNRTLSDRRPVVAVVLTLKGLILIARRTGGGPHAGMWEYPGGKMERGESPVAAARREIDEELATAIGDVRWLGECWATRERRQSFYFFTARASHPPRKHPCHDRLAWVPFDGLAHYELAPVDRRASRVFERDLRTFISRNHAKQ